MITLTQQSYQNLLEAGCTAWRQAGVYYTDLVLIPEDKRSLIEVKKSYRLNALIPNDRSVLSNSRFPEDINYNTGLTIGLTTETIDYFGLRVAQVFYQNIDPIIKEFITPIPIVFERYKYTWDEVTNLPTARVKEIHFYYEDNSISEQFKLLPKNFYNTSDRANIVRSRRDTIVSWLIARATELGLGTQVKDYFSLYKNETDKYILYGDRDIIQIVEEDTQQWLDTDTTTTMGTIRSAIVLCFIKALEPTSNEEVTLYLERTLF